MSACSPFQCWPDRQTVCIRLAPQSSRTLARWFGRRDCKAKRKAARLCRQAAPASAGQAGKQFASDWHHRASARLLDGWSETSLMMTPLRSKEECGRLGRQAAPGRAAPASADQAGKQFAFAWHGSAAASLLDGWSTIPDDGVTAKQRGRWQPLSASSSFQCRPDKQTVCTHLTPKSCRMLARLVRNA